MTDELNEEITEEEIVAEAAEDEADFAAEFGEEEDEYEEAKPEVEKEEKEEEQEEEKQEEEKPDPLAEAMTTIHALNDRLRKQEGKYGDLNSQIKELKEAKNNQPPAGHPSREDVKAAISDPDKLDDLKERYPVWAEEVESREAIMHARLGVDEFVTKEDLAAFVTADSMRGYVTKEENSANIARERQMTLLEVRHPRWRQVRESAEFNEWMGKQDAAAVELFNSDYAVDAISLLDSYNEQTNELKKQSEKKDRLSRAVPATTGGRSSTQKSSTEEDEFLAAFKG